MTTLTEFLLARIAEDEAAAYRAAGPESQPIPGYAERREASLRRPLAECEAKRRIIHLHRIGANDYETGTCHTWYGDGDDTERDLTCPTMRALAVPYADHEGFRDEWRP